MSVRVTLELPSVLADVAGGKRSWLSSCTGLIRPSATCSISSPVFTRTSSGACVRSQGSCDAT